MSEKRKPRIEPPVKEGDVIEAECISLGKKNDGIFKRDKFVVIAPGVEVGKTYKLKITKVFRNVSFAEVCKDEPSEE